MNNSKQIKWYFLTVVNWNIFILEKEITHLVISYIFIHWFVSSIKTSRDSHENNELTSSI